jgi:HEAT repeat protein
MGAIQMQTSREASTRQGRVLARAQWQEQNADHRAPPVLTNLLIRWPIGLSILVLLSAFPKSDFAQSQDQDSLLLGGKSQAAWLSLLEDKNISVRRRSCEALGLLSRDGAAVVPALVRAANDPDKSVRNAAVEAIGWIGPEAQSAVPFLLSKISATSIAENSENYRQALAGIGRPAVAGLIVLLDARLRESQIKSAETLGMIGRDAEAAVPALLRQLGNAKGEARLVFAVVNALGRLGSTAKSAAPTLKELLPSSIPGNWENYIDVAVTEALTRIGDPPIDLFLKKLESTDEGERVYAARMLGVIGPGARASVPALLRLLKDDRLGLQTHAELAFALSKIAPTCSPIVPALINAIDTNPDDALLALRRLGMCAHSALPELRKLVFEFDDSIVCCQIIETLCWIDPEGLEIVPTLIRAFQQKTPEREANPQVRAAAARALGRIGPRARECVPALARVLAHPDPDTPDDNDHNLRLATAFALRRIGADPTSGVPELLNLLADKGQRELHRYAIIAIAGYGPAAKPALSPLIAALGGQDRDVAVYALGRIGRDARIASAALREALRAAGINKRALAWAMLRIDPANIREVEEVLENDLDLRDRAGLLALLWRSSPEGIALTRVYMRSLDHQLDLEDVGDSSSMYPSERTVYALGELGSSARAALPTLVSLLRHANPCVRQAAERAIGQIEGTEEPWAGAASR